MDVAAYLHRIGYDGPTAPNLDNLRAMHHAHFMSVPFENLDIHLGRHVELDPARIFHKIVQQRRGGWCYELNGLWARMLREFGYTVDVLSTRVMRPDGSLSVPYSHLTSLVHLDGEPWLSDVDLSARFAGPLRLHEPGPQVLGSRIYRVGNDGDHWVVSYQEPHVSNGFILFTLEPREFEQFAPACAWQQSSPASQFVQRIGVARATPHGRIDVLGPIVSEVIDGERTERRLESVQEFEALLAERFGIVLGGHSWLPHVAETFRPPAS
jgi:N-hydroxyarylamine O-acetyltransferase